VGHPISVREGGRARIWPVRFVSPGRESLFIFSLCLLASTFQESDHRFEIPYEKLSEKHQKKVRRVMDDVTVVVPLDAAEVESRSELYDFLLEELPFTSEVCRELGRAKYEVFRDLKVPEKEEAKSSWFHTYYLNDKEGLSVKVELVLAEERRRIFYTWGSYDLSPLPSVWGRSVIFVLWEEKEGKLLTDAKVFAQVDSDVYKALSDLVQGMIRGIIKEKSTVFVKAARWVSESMAEDPKKLYTQLLGAKEVDQETLERFRARFIP
jgi:hypothetical protein